MLGSLLLTFAKVQTFAKFPAFSALCRHIPYLARPFVLVINSAPQTYLLMFLNPKSPITFQMDSIKSITALPNELLIQIISYAGVLEKPPPTALTYKGEEHLNFTPTLQHPLRILGNVCQKWREIALPMLVEDCCVSLTVQKEYYPGRHLHVSMALMLLLKTRRDLIGHKSYIQRVLDRHDEKKTANGGFVEDMLVEVDGGFLDALPRGERHLRWIVSLHSETEALINLINRHNLHQYIKTLTIHTEQAMANRPNYVESLIKKEVRLLWKRIFRAIKPDRITIAAPPTTMVDLANSKEATFDTWAFGMRYHFLEFSLDPSKESEDERTTREDYERRTSNALPALHQRRPWTSMTYNEGTMIRGYSHYEWQEKVPPKLLPHLLENICITQRFSESPKIRSLTYVSYFPYSEHVKHVMIAASKVPSLRCVGVRFADTDIISDPEKLGKGQSADCWTEWEGSYKSVVREGLGHLGDGAVFESFDDRGLEVVMSVAKEIEELVLGMKRDGETLRWVKEASKEEYPVRAYS